jgi:hypothetical protein
VAGRVGARVCAGEAACIVARYLPTVVVGTSAAAIASVYVGIVRWLRRGHPEARLGGRYIDAGIGGTWLGFVADEQAPAERDGKEG